MAAMNIAERFVPQDGHITFSAPKGKIDLRVSTVPTIFGECVVMRFAAARPEAPGRSTASASF